MKCDSFDLKLHESNKTYNPGSSNWAISQLGRIIENYAVNPHGNASTGMGQSDLETEPLVPSIY
jgi:hypothetical protein